jgi:hypothetical protein
MTNEERAMSDKCKAEYVGMLKRLDMVIRDKWPETLRDDGGVWLWLVEQRVEQRQKLNTLRKRISVAWDNGVYEEMRQLVRDWGKLTLEIFQEYALHLKKVAAV